MKKRKKEKLDELISTMIFTLMVSMIFALMLLSFKQGVLHTQETDEQIRQGKIQAQINIDSKIKKGGV